MLVNFRKMDGVQTLETDLCIVGAGPAGVPIAQRFIGSGVDVCLLEAGGMNRDKATQALYAGENVGLPYYALHKTRLRYFGGSSNHWSGRCAPLDDIDFRHRPWVPHSGWPFERRELEPFYEQAQWLCNLGPMVYDESAWALLGLSPPPLDPSLLSTGFWQFSSPVPRFGHREKDQLSQAWNVRVVLHANVTNVQLNANATAVEHLDVASLEGRRARIKARVYVLACGGIETPRLLLASQGVEPQGVGNARGLVGRFFMEHPKGITGYLETPYRETLLGLYRKHFPAGQVPFWAMLRPSAQLQEREQILNTSVALFYDPAPDSGAAAALSLYEDLRERRWPRMLPRKLARIVRDGPGLGLRALHRRFVERKAPLLSPGTPYLLSRAEQAPNPDSRITLSEERDALGMQRVRLDWRMSEIDKRSLAVLTRVISQEFERLGLGRVSVEQWLQDGTAEWPKLVGAGHHHMGTTRMGDDPAVSVVDRHGRVHGKHNLYIAGSSLFPTGGCANPTLTIVALSLRMADHLKAVLV